MVKAATAQRFGAAGDLLAADVGQRIREARQARGLSLAQVGGEDLSRSFLSLVETGRSRISLRALAIVAARLELPMSHFLSGREEASALTAQLLLQEAEIALGQGQAAEALHLLDEADHAGREATGNQARYLRARALVECGQAVEAVSVLREGLAELESEPDRYFQAQYHYLAGATLYRTGGYDEAEAHLRQALDTVMPQADDPILTGKIIVCLGHIHYLRRHIDQAITHYQDAIAWFGKVRDFHTQATVYSGLSLAFKRKGEMERALHYARLSASMYRVVDDRRGVAEQLNNMAVAFEEQGDLDQALTLANEALAKAQDGGGPGLEALVHSTLAGIYFDQGEIDRAAAEAQVGDDMAPPGDVMARVDSWIVLAKIAVHREAFEQAQTQYERALESLKQAGRQTKYAETAIEYSAFLEGRGEMRQAYHYAVEAAKMNVTRAP